MQPISEAEWRVMSVLWERDVATAGEIIASLEGAVTWSPKTVKSLLGRLVKKGHVEFVPRGREYVYRPRVDKHDCLRREARSFLQRFFSSSLSPLVAELIDGGDLSQRDLDELKALLGQRAPRARRQRRR
jgi:BlaI family penicillinase repressor